MDDLRTALLRAQEECAFLDGRQSPRSEGATMGMGAVELTWHPYKCGWLAKASWSDRTGLCTAVHKEPIEALNELLYLLKTYPSLHFFVSST